MISLGPHPGTVTTGENGYSLRVRIYSYCTTTTAVQTVGTAEDCEANSVYRSHRSRTPK